MPRRIRSPACRLTEYLPVDPFPKGRCLKLKSHGPCEEIPEEVGSGVKAQERANWRFEVLG